MNPRSFMYTSLKCIIFSCALLQLPISKASFRCICVFTAYVNIYAYTQFPDHTGSFYGCSLHLHFFSLHTFTPHFLLNKKSKPDIFIFLSSFRTSCLRKIGAEMRIEYFFGLKSFSRCLSSCMSLICLSDHSVGVSWLLECAGTRENWSQFFLLLLPTWTTRGKSCKV